MFIAAVAAGFWGVSRYPALSDKAAMSGTEAFEDPMTHQAHFHVPDQASLPTRVLYTTLNWYETNWKGMAFGLVLAGAFLTVLSYLPKPSSDRRFKNSLIGMLVGTPLGVCVNCVAPIAKGLYDAGSKMETALAVMFSSPTLNIVVLTMLFSIFPFHMALMKLGATFLLVLLIVPWISKKDVKRKNRETAAGAEVCEVDLTPETWAGALRGAVRDYWKSFSYIFVRTFPLMLLAGFLGAVLTHLWSFDKFIGLEPNWKTLAVLSFMGTFLPLPIAFDLMLTQALMMSRLADGFVMTLLFTLGTFSIYSAMVVTRTFSLKVAVKLYLIIVVLGMGLGYGAQVYSDFKYLQWLGRYEVFIGSGEASFQAAVTEPRVPDSVRPAFRLTQPVASQKFWTDQNVDVQWSVLQDRVASKGPLFEKHLGPEWGLTYSNRMTPENFFDPLFFGRGIASGDFNRDGWVDVAVATDNGFELYQNVNGRRFVRMDGPPASMAGKQGLTVALVDMDNDGWLDVFLTTFHEGNYLWLNPLGGKKKQPVLRVPNNQALATTAPAFADVNRDGWLDIVNGNYYLGVLTRKPIDTSVDQLVINRGLKFEPADLEGVPGQTHTVLFSDVNGDGLVDLMIGNDYQVSDTYYFGENQGRFRKIRRQDGIIPITTENTMSMDTADFNNDLQLDLYLANIGMSKGLDVVSNIFGSAMQEAGREFCDSRDTVLNHQECHDLLKLVTLLNPEKQDPSERCSIFQDREQVGECMVARLALTATRRSNPALCGRIGPDHTLSKIMCEKYFLPRRVHPDTRGEIPLRSMSNILLQAGTDTPFLDISQAAQVETAEWSWNARFADLDNDEWQDLYVVNGVLITQEFATNNFFHNREGKTFQPAEEEFGLQDFDHSSAYTYLDIDNDGDLDIIGNTLYGPFKIYINHESENNRVMFRLEDGRGNRHCIGCRVTIHYGPEGKRHQMREIKASGGYRSFDAPVAHFGLGPYDVVQKVEVRWSDGIATVIGQPFPVNRKYLLYRKPL
ncbi:MAG: hypothetical protein GWN57_11580 [Nitrospinaceae bacterium]|nr:hypothetical protein [Nitrospinaceae bacterium]